MAKPHYSILLYDQVMPLFGLRKSLLKFCMLINISKTSTDSGSKLHIHVWDENVSLYNQVS